MQASKEACTGRTQDTSASPVLVDSCQEQHRMKRERRRRGKLSQTNEEKEEKEKASRACLDAQQRQQQQQWSSEHAAEVCLSVRLFHFRRTAAAATTLLPLQLVESDSGQFGTTVVEKMKVQANYKHIMTAKLWEGREESAEKWRKIETLPALDVKGH